MAIVVVGDRRAIEQGLREIEGVSDDLVFLDAEGRPAQSSPSGGGQR
jgi:hypothetical protein